MNEAKAMLEIMFTADEVPEPLFRRGMAAIIKASPETLTELLAAMNSLIRGAVRIRDYLAEAWADDQKGS